MVHVGTISIIRARRRTAEDPPPSGRRRRPLTTRSMSSINQSIEHAALTRRPEPTEPGRDAFAHPFGLLPKILHRLSTIVTPVRSVTASRRRDPRRPRIVALEHRRRGQRDQRVDEREPVVQRTDTGEALTHQRDRLIGVATAHAKMART